MHERYIVRSYSSSGYGGHHGAGDTLEEAEKALRAAGGRKRDKREWFHFTSPHPFVPIGETREAGEMEADAYVCRDGSLAWVRCSRFDGSMGIVWKPKFEYTPKEIK